VGRCLIDQFKQAQADAGVESMAWVIMPDHFHWLIVLKDRPLATVVGRVKSRSALSLNQHFSTRGAFWQKGYHDRALRRSEDIKTAARYIVSNPVRAGLVEHVRDYPLWDAIWL